MTIQELDIATENDGLMYSLDNDLIDIEDIDDTVLADMLYALKEVVQDVKNYMHEKLKPDDNCFMCD